MMQDMMDGGLMDGPMMGGGMAVAMGLWMLLWALVGVALLVLAILGSIWLVRRGIRPASGAATTESAVEVLRRRYAGGEMDDEEFRRRLSVLSS